MQSREDAAPFTIDGGTFDGDGGGASARPPAQVLPLTSTTARRSSS